MITVIGLTGLTGHQVFKCRSHSNANAMLEEKASVSDISLEVIKLFHTKPRFVLLWRQRVEPIFG